MTTEMGFEIRGPEGIKTRVQELRARMGLDGGAFAASLDSALKAKPQSVGQPNPLTGKIGDADLKPFNPMEGGLDAALYKKMARSIAERHGIDPNLFDALIEAESSYNPNLESPAGAKGLTQLMKATADELGVKNPFDPVENMNAGAKYLKMMIDRYPADLRLALAAYNAGPGKVDRANGVPNIPETQRYVERIMARMGASQR